MISLILLWRELVLKVDKIKYILLIIKEATHVQFAVYRSLENSGLCGSSFILEVVIW